MGNVCPPAALNYANGIGANSANINQLKNEHKEVKAKIEEIKKQMQEHIDKKALLDAENKEYDTTLGELNKRLHALQQELEDLNKAIKNGSGYAGGGDQEDAVKNLQTAITKAIGNEKELEKLQVILRDKIERLKIRRTEVIKEIADIEAEIAEIKKKKKKNQAEIDAHEKKIDELEKKKKVHEDRLKEIEDKLKEETGKQERLKKLKPIIDVYNKYIPFYNQFKMNLKTTIEVLGEVKLTETEEKINTQIETKIGEIEKRVKIDEERYRDAIKVMRDLFGKIKDLKKEEKNELISLSVPRMYVYPSNTGNDGPLISIGIFGSVFASIIELIDKIKEIIKKKTYNRDGRGGTGTKPRRDAISFNINPHELGSRL